MTNNKSESDKQEKDHQDAPVKSDPETLNTTDPQEHMEGPISSLMQKTEESFENDEPHGKPSKEKDE